MPVRPLRSPAEEGRHAAARLHLGAELRRSASRPIPHSDPRTLLSGRDNVPRADDRGPARAGGQARRAARAPPGAGAGCWHRGRACRRQRGLGTALPRAAASALASAVAARRPGAAADLAPVEGRSARGSSIGAARVSYDKIGFGFAPLPLGPAIAVYTVFDRRGPVARAITFVLVIVGVTISQTTPATASPTTRSSRH